MASKQRIKCHAQGHNTGYLSRGYSVMLKDTTHGIYVGHPISSDNGLISQKLLLKSELYYPFHVAMGVVYSCMKYGVFIIT